jgi:hypothetical protein
MTRRRRVQSPRPGVRHIAGREFILGGRGTRAAMERERAAALASGKWTHARILPYGRNTKATRAISRLLDDYGLWLF